MINLESLSLPELLELQKQLPTVIARRQTEVRKDLLQKASAMVARHGLTLDELMKGSRKRHGVKYANPGDPSQTWSGVGSRPRWVRELLAAGKTLEDLKVVDQAGNTDN